MAVAGLRDRAVPRRPAGRPRVGLFNALVWPALAFVLVPLSVYTLGLANLAVNVLLTWAVLDALPGVRLDGFWAALLVTLVATVIATLLATALALDDDSWYDERMARFARRRRGTTVTDVPGVVFVQIDGLSEPVLRVALASGDVPTLHRWLDDDNHRVVGWRTEWSSQTGVSQCGILHGSTDEHAGVPLGGEGDRRGDRLQPPEVGGRDRAPPQRRRRAPGPQRLELRQPLHR